MLNIKNKLISGILIMLLGIGVCGCSMGNKKSETKEQIIAQMNEHLADKYGDVQYEMDGFDTNGWNQNYDVLYAKTTNVDDGPFYFEVRRYTKENTYEFKDTYFEILIQDEIKETISSYADHTLGDYYLYMTSFAPVDGYSNDMVAGKTFQDAIKAGEYEGRVATLKIAVCNNDKIQSDEFMDMSEKFVEACSKLGVGIDYNIYLLDSEDYKAVCEDHSIWGDMIYMHPVYLAKYEKTVK